MNIQIGDMVNYHSIIGGAVTSEGHEVTDIEQTPNNFGCNVAWITGKSGCVALEALSNDKNPPIKPPCKMAKMTRSQKRYQAYLDSEVGENFSEFIKYRMYERYE
jgi:hypothetical protein